MERNTEELGDGGPVSYETLIVEHRGQVGWLILNRPDSLNAHNVKMLSELPLAWKELDADDGVRVIVMTGKGRGFCAGADVKEVAASGGGMGDRMSALIESSEPVLASRAIEQRLEASDCSSERSLRWLRPSSRRRGGYRSCLEFGHVRRQPRQCWPDSRSRTDRTDELNALHRGIANGARWERREAQRVRRLSSRLRDPGYRSTGAIRRDRPVPGRSNCQEFARRDTPHEASSMGGA